MTAFATDTFAARDAFERMSAGPQGKTTEKLPFLAVLFMFCVVVPVSASLGGVYLTSLRVLLLAVTLPLLVNMLMGRYGPRLPTDWLFLGHAIWLTLALAINNPDRVLQQAPSVGVEFLGGYVVARATIRNREQFLAFCRLLSLIVLALLPFAILETLTGEPHLLKYIRSLPGITSYEVVHADPRMGLERVQSLFAHPIHFGLFCSVAFSLCFVGLRGQTTEPRRYIFSVLIGFASFLALSSGALLAIALQVGLIVWAFLLRKQEKRWWILVGLFAALWVLIDILSNRSPFQVFMSYATFSAHNAYWRSIIFEWGVMNIFGSVENNIPASFFFGLGLNDWVRPSYMYSGSMDNFWLVMGVRYGFPGFLLIALGFAIQIYKLMRLRLPYGHPLLFVRRACVFTFLGLSFTLATVHVWGNIFSFVVFLVGATAWLVQPGATELSSPDDAGPAPDESTPKRDARGPVYTRFSNSPGQAPRPAPMAKPPAPLRGTTRTQARKAALAYTRQKR